MSIDVHIEGNGAPGEPVVEVIPLSPALSWLEFNERVLAEAANRRNPLLERLNFVSIFNSNLDEFFMKRVGGIKRQLAAGISPRGIDGLTPTEALAQIRKRLLPILADLERIFRREIIPELAEERIELLSWDRLSKADQEYGARYFFEKVFPVLTPLAVDSGHPFPFISNLSTSVGVALGHPEHEEPLFARVKMSGLRPNWIRVNPGESSYRFVSCADLILAHIGALFPGMNILGAMTFRVARNVNLEIDDEDAEDLMELIEEELRQRRVAQVVRFEHGPNPDEWIRSFLIEELSLTQDDVWELSGGLDYQGLQELRALDFPKLKFPIWVGITPPELVDEPAMLGVLKHQDLLVHHPYESFSASVERLVREAADDPEVLSIKMTVYRIGDKTPIIGSLIRAAENGKHVVCLVELKARFEEQRNIEWAATLEQAGVHVVYGVPGMKTHAKTILIARQESDRIRLYAHLGTGNYHVNNASMYTDLGLFTSDREITGELVHFFNYLTGRSRKSDYRKLLVAPVTMEDRFLGLIDREIENRRAGRPARIIAKTNGLDDLDIINALYRASQAGVAIDLFVRGICCLRPGVAGVSDGIRVRSIVGRFLEHSRIMYFRNGAIDPLDGDFFISSADWMGRNLHRRVEIAVPVSEPEHRARIWEVLQVLDQDRKQAWELRSDGSYVRVGPGEPGAALGTHEVLIERAKEEQALAAFLP